MGAWWLFWRAQAYHRRGACRRAARLYQQVLERDPSHRGAWLWRGLALAQCGRYAEARKHLERARALDPASAAARLFLARVAYDAGEVEQAHQILMDCQSCEQNQQAQGLLALCWLRQGDREKAGKILERGLPHAPWLLARLLAALEENSAAAPTEPPPAPAAFSARVFRWGAVRRGLVYLRAEQWEKARNAFESALHSRPQDPRATYGLGVSLFYLDHFEESRELLRGVVNQLSEPFRSDAEATLGKVALELGEAQEGLLLLRRAIAAGAATAENYYALGRAALRRGRITLARKAFERCASVEFVRQRWSETISAA